MPINVRECLFEDENYLTYFQTYSRVVSIVQFRDVHGNILLMIVFSDFAELHR